MTVTLPTKDRCFLFQVLNLTTKVDVLNMYARKKEKIKKEIASIPTKISLSNSRLACTTKGYICLTTHFVDTDWKLNSKI